MELLSKLLRAKGNSPNFGNEQVLGVPSCVNCWGRSEYEGQFQQNVLDQCKTKINRGKLCQMSFILKFVERNITGVRMK